jgi:hypothetical protein
MNSVIEAIQRCEWLFLRSIHDLGDNTLRLVVEEARAGVQATTENNPDAKSVPGLQDILQGARLIEHAEGCSVFEIYWDSYVAYSVRNESFVANDKYEHSEGRLFVRYSKSRFLDYVALGTFATEEYPGPLLHWGVICGNHIIDVVGTEAPSTRLLQ